MSKPLPTLCQMPWNIKQLIVHSANTVTKHSLSPCSKEFNNLVTHSPMCYQRLEVDIGCGQMKATVLLRIDDNVVKRVGFQQGRNRYAVQILGKRPSWQTDDVFDAIVEQTVKLFRNPKASFRSFQMNIQGHHATKAVVLDKFQAFFVSLNRQVPVTYFTMSFDGYDNHNLVLQILPFLEPRTLKLISLFSSTTFRDYPADDLALSEIAETEQWRHAERLSMVSFNLAVPFDKWAHFSNLDFHVKELKVELVREMFESYLHNPQFNLCEIRCLTIHHRQILKFLFQFSSTITTATGGITTVFNVQNQPDICFQVFLQKNLMVLRKIERDMVKAGDRLEAAEVLADVTKWIK